MAYGFALHGNEPIQPHYAGEIRDVQWFKLQLQQLRVSPLVIVWGDYVEHFNEIPPFLMDGYLRHRKRLLHRQALEQAQREYDASK